MAQLVHDFINNTLLGSWEYEYRSDLINLLTIFFVILFIILLFKLFIWVFRFLGGVVGLNRYYD
jgi:hypothetical protein